MKNDDISIKMPDDFGEKLNNYLKDVQNRHMELDKRSSFKSGIMEKIFNINYRYIHFEDKRADLYFAGVLIETKADLTNKSIEDGKEELQRYLPEWPNTVRAVITDCVDFKIYTDLSKFENPDLSSINPNIEFSLNDSESDYTHYKELLDLLYPSTVFNKLDASILVPRIREKIIEIASHIDISNEIKYKAWRSYIAIALGDENDADENSYKRQAVLYYFTVFLTAKILGYETPSKNIISGDAFSANGIINFIDPDNFFDFLSDDEVNDIEKEIENYKFIGNGSISEEAFRLLYEELISPNNRHALGEFYTPSWLAQILVDAEIKTGNENILDPSCGSGTFLRLAIKKIRELKGHGTVSGFDINPIAVQVSKANYLMENKDFTGEIPVFLGDSLMPYDESMKVKWSKNTSSVDQEGEVTLNFDSIIGEAGSAKFYYNTDLELKDITEAIEKMKKITFDDVNDDLDAVKNKLAAQFGMDSTFVKNANVMNKIKDLEKQDKDRIWFYILRNIYTPYYMKNKIDLVIGNPPWLQFNKISNARQRALEPLYKYYHMSAGGNYKTHLDVVEFFIARSTEFLRNETSKIAFVTTRAIMNSGQYSKIRIGELKNTSKGQNGNKNIFITKIWDMPDKNLFNVPACMVEFSYLTNVNHEVQGYKIMWDDKSSVLNPSNINITEHKFYVYKMGVSNEPLEDKKLVLNDDEIFTHVSNEPLEDKKQENTAAEEVKLKPKIVNVYMDKFKEGATIIYRDMFFVEKYKEYKYAYEVTTGYSNGKKIREKVKFGKVFNHDLVPKDIVFPVILGSSLDKYKLNSTENAVLPVYISYGKIKPLLVPKDSKYNFILDQDYISTLKNDAIIKLYKNYEKKFNKLEEMWEQKRMEDGKFDKSVNGSASMSLYKRLNYNDGLESQQFSKKYTIVYNASGANIKSVVIDNNKNIIDKKGYYMYTSSKEEAYYLCGILNSDTLMQKFKHTGSKSMRDIDKKVFNVYFPEFHSNNATHIEIAKLAEEISNDIKNGMKLADKKKELDRIEELVNEILL